MCRSSLVLILLGSLVALIPFADAISPDPVWIAGVYDGDDSDEVILSWAFPDGVLGPALLPDLKPLLMVVGSLSLGLSPALAVSALLAFQFRSPPMA